MCTIPSASVGEGQIRIMLHQKVSSLAEILLLSATLAYKQGYLEITVGTLYHTSSCDADNYNYSLSVEDISTD
jgi:hypothetical protein